MDLRRFVTDDHLPAGHLNICRGKASLICPVGEGDTASVTEGSREGQLSEGLVMESLADERNLLESLEGGNGAAFWRLWHLHRPHLYEICSRILTATDAEDALSRSMLVARAKLPSYATEIVNLEAWLTRLAGNVCKDMLREQRAGRALSLDDPESGDSAAAAADPHLSPEEEYVLVEMRGKINVAIAGLPARLRMAATLYFIDELPYTAIAQQLHITNENARKRVQQARAALRRELQPLAHHALPAT